MEQSRTAFSFIGVLTSDNIFTILMLKNKIITLFLIKIT